MKNRFKKIAILSVFSSLVLLTGCTSTEQTLATGAIAGAVVAGAVSNHTQNNNQPYYYDNGRYYYGGRYTDGYYYYHGHRYRYGHYYNHGYRYHNGRRYRARVGQHGYQDPHQHRRWYKRNNRYWKQKTDTLFKTQRERYDTEYNENVRRIYR